MDTYEPGIEPDGPATPDAPAWSAPTDVVMEEGASAVAASSPNQGQAPAGRSGRARWLIGGTVAVLAVAGAIAAAVILGAKPLPEAFRYLPADSVVVIELRPDLPGDQKQHLGNLLAHFPGFADQSSLEAKLDETFGRLVSRASGGSVDYTTRIKPLLAGPMVMAIGNDALAAMSTGSAADAARGLFVATTTGTVSCDVVFGTSSAVETYRGVEIRSVQNDASCAVEGHYMLVGDTASILAGLDAHADKKGIDTSSAFSTARSRLTGDQLGMVYLDGKATANLLENAAPSAGIDAALTSSVPDWMVIGLQVVDDAIQVEVRTAAVAAPSLPSGVPTAPAAATSQFAPMLPGDTFGFVEVHGAGANIQRALATLKADASQAAMVDQIEQALAAAGGVDNLTAWIEDVGVAAVPTDAGVGGVIMVRGSDASAVASRLAQIKNLLILASTGTDITVKDADHGGVTVTTVDLGDLQSLLSGLGADTGVSLQGQRLAFSMATRDDVLILALGDGVMNRVLDTGSGSSLASSASYRRTVGLVGSPNDVEVYVAIDGLVGWAETQFPADMDITTWTTDIKPYLEHIAAFGEASLSNDTGGSSRIVITVK